ncbi:MULTISPECIES: hypothetical protein [Pseudomonas]|nr:hypothetical protein [Pseudomonas sp. SWRI77]
MGVEAGLQLMFGISFGYADPQSPANFVEVGRAALDESVVRHF